MVSFIGGLHDRGMDYLGERSAEAIAECTGVDVSTARRWKSGVSRIPTAARLLLSGDLGAHGSKSWRGWRVVGDELVSPEGWRVTCGDVLSIPLMRQQIATYQGELRRLKGMDAQPEPKELNYGSGTLREASR